MSVPPPPPPSTGPSSPASPHSLRIDRQAARSTGRGRRGWRLAAWGLGALAVVAAVGVWQARKPLPVQTVTVQTGTPSQQFVELTASGYVVAQRRAAVSSKATGRLVELQVREGSRVRQGQVIARLDASDVQAALLAAQAGVRQAEVGVRQAQVELANALAELRRSQGLQAQGFISPQAVDAAQTRHKAAQASVQAAEAAVRAAQAQVRVQQVNEDFTAIRAPFDGVVLVKNANIGDIITPFSNAAGSQGAVVTMADMGTLEVEADVSESSLAKVRVGQPVEIVLDALPGVRFKGRVGGIVPTVDRAKATVMTKIRFDRLDARILPEMSAKVSFLSRDITAADQQPVLAVAPAALRRLGDGPAQVWRLRSGDTAGAAGASASGGDAAAPRWTVEPVAVRAGRVLGDLVEVTAVPPATLQAGDKLVVGADDGLQSGRAVQPGAP